MQFFIYMTLSIFAAYIMVEALHILLNKQQNPETAKTKQLLLKFLKPIPLRVLMISLLYDIWSNHGNSLDLLFSYAGLIALPLIYIGGLILSPLGKFFEAKD